MAILKPLIVPRSNVASQNPFRLDGSRGVQGFYTPSHKYFGWEVIPHDNKSTDGSPSFMAPLSHYHLLQLESFHVESGYGYWFLQGKKIRLHAGDNITIPRFRAHRFESIPNEKQEPLVILYRYDPQRWEMEERFFRNTLTYLEDCSKHGVAPSLPQLCIFLADCWMPGEFIKCPGGDYVRCAVNALFMWVMAFIGLYVYGYQHSYIEYYDPHVSKKRILAESSKGK